MRVLAVSALPSRREGNSAEILLFNLMRAADASLELRLIARAACPDVDGVDTDVPRRPHHRA